MAILKFEHFREAIRRGIMSAVERNSNTNKPPTRILILIDRQSTFQMAPPMKSSLSLSPLFSATATKATFVCSPNAPNSLLINLQLIQIIAVALIANPLCAIKNDRSTPGRRRSLRAGHFYGRAIKISKHFWAGEKNSSPMFTPQERMSK